MHPLHVLDVSATGELETWSEELQWVGTTRGCATCWRVLLWRAQHLQHGSSIYNGAVNCRIPRSEEQFLCAVRAGHVDAADSLRQAEHHAGLRYSEDHIHAQTIHRCNYVTIPGWGPVAELLQPRDPGVPDSFTLSLGKTFGREGAGFRVSPWEHCYQWTDG